MTYLLIFIIIILIILCGYQYATFRSRSKNLSYICDKLSSIISDKSDEKVLVLTDDKDIQKLLNQINNLLEYNKTISVNYRKIEISMRKMLSNISHDLKTPLTVVLGYIETIKLDKNMSYDEKELLLSKIHAKSIEVLELINKFFDLAKLESGDKELKIIKINLNEICKKNILVFYDILTAKGYDVKIDIPDTNVYALANEEALDRILDNLISNAIKYGSDGKILGLSLRTDEEFVYIDLWDKGKGIDTIHMDRVFERMYTMDDSRNKLYQGSGLGLTITKRLVEKLGGEISLYSEPYNKTVFTVKLRKLEY